MNAEDGTPQPTLSRRLGGIRAAAPRLVFELVIVFVGVSAAFVVERWRADYEARQHAIQVTAALQTDLEQFVEVTMGFVKDMNEGLRQWSQSHAAGNRPPPFFYRIPGSEKPPVGVWQAALASRVADFMDPRLLFDLAFFYSEIDGVGERYARYNAFTEQEIMTRLKRADPGFYDPTTGELNPEFAAHMERLHEIQGWMTAHAEVAAALAERLGSGRHRRRGDAY